MTDIINLRQVRKRREREADATQADANRLRFGRPARERKLAEARTDLQDRHLDGHKLDRPQGKGRSES